MNSSQVCHRFRVLSICNRARAWEGEFVWGKGKEKLSKAISQSEVDFFECFTTKAKACWVVSFNHVYLDVPHGKRCSSLCSQQLWLLCQNWHRYLPLINNCSFFLHLLPFPTLQAGILHLRLSKVEFSKQTALCSLPGTLPVP